MTRDPGDDGAPELARLAELRAATAAIRPSPGFTDRVMAAALAPAPARPAALTRAGRYAVPFAAVLAAAALVLAWRAGADAGRRRAADEVRQALADPEVSAW